MTATEENTEPVMMLDTQYRMAPSICEWPSKYFYGGKLKTAANLPRTGPCYDYRYSIVWLVNFSTELAKIIILIEFSTCWMDEKN